MEITVLLFFLLYAFQELKLMWERLLVDIYSNKDNQVFNLSVYYLDLIMIHLSKILKYLIIRGHNISYFLLFSFFKLSINFLISNC